jgi:hypothetical protein
MSESDQRETLPSIEAPARGVSDPSSSSSSTSRQAAWYSRTKRVSVHPAQHARISGSLVPPSQYHFVSQVSMPPAPDSSISSELLRRMLASRCPTPMVATPLIPAYTQSTLREQILALLGDRSNGDLRQTAQFPGNSDPPAVFGDGSSRYFQQTLSATAQFSSYKGSANDLQTSSQLAPAEQHIVAMMRGQRSSLPAPRSPTLEHQLVLLMNEQRAQHDIAALARSINPASSNLPADPPPPEQPSLEHLQLHVSLLSQLQRNASLQTHQGFDSHASAPPFDSLLQGLAAPQPPVTPSTATSIRSPHPPNRGHGSQQVSFPAKLYNLLANVERQGATHIVSFTPDGRAFKIHDPDAFMRDVAPDFFRQSHITSFVRQLNFYGFDRVPHGPNRGAFAHPSFLRGRPELLDSIERQIVPPRAKKR